LPHELLHVGLSWCSGSRIRRAAATAPTTTATTGRVWRRTTGRVRARRATTAATARAGHAVGGELRANERFVFRTDAREIDDLRVLLDVGAAIEEDLHRVDAIERDGEHERRLTARRLFRIHVRAAIGGRCRVGPSNFAATSAAWRQWSRRFRIGARFQQGVDDLTFPVSLAKMGGV
jgi:hypothetical protein